jgi:hypothetical protein
VTEYLVAVEHEGDHVPMPRTFQGASPSARAVMKSRS